jgi:hypothetical protein
MLNEGATALPYVPYMENSLLIPVAIQSVTGYGLGVNSQYYNFLEWTPDSTFVSFHQLCSAVDLSSLNWTYYTSGTPRWESSSISNVIMIDSQNPLMVAQNYAVVPLSVQDVGDIAITEQGYLRVLSNDSVNKPSGQLVYALSNPVTSQISGQITLDNMISIQGGGILIFENESAKSVPSTVEYITAETSA